MATQRSLMSVTFRSGDQDYRLTSRGKLLVQLIPDALKLTGSTAEPLWQEVTHRVLAQRVLYGELSKHITPQEEEPEP